jgi:hypothetical protein
MFELTAHEIENLVDLVEIKMLAMLDGNFADDSELASLNSCRAKLLKIVESIPGVTLVPFNEALAI